MNRVTSKTIFKCKLTHPISDFLNEGGSSVGRARIHWFNSR